MKTFTTALVLLFALATYASIVSLTVRAERTQMGHHGEYAPGQQHARVVY
jgi:hypothetical protein